ncbi:hypothetical protein MKW92_037725 [Papaver armeniacum]|nr:hypothetical protein MKW92_037725 [Papaver armeniacum]
MECTCKPIPARFNSVTLPSLLQVIPYHLHGLIVPLVEFVFQDGRREEVWLIRVDFHCRRAFTSPSSCTCFADGVRGLYRGFGMSILTYAPSNAVWWASYSVTQRLVWGGVGCYFCKKEENINENGSSVSSFRPDSKTVMAVQGLSAAMAGGVSALITMPLDTIKTRLQVLDGEGNDKRPPTIGQTVKNLVKEGGWSACYRGLGPRWASMSMSATTMITTYEFLKRMSAKNQESLT